MAGRVCILKLLPLNYSELYRYNISNFKDLIILGGYPELYNNVIYRNMYFDNYIEIYIQRDVKEYLDVRNIHEYKQLLYLLASRTGQTINYSNLAKNVGVGLRTIKNWISILISSYIIFEISPYHTNINKRITKSSKIYFYDSGLLSYLLNINSVNEYEHNILKGQVFENFVMSETFKKYENNYGINGMFFYRDSNKLEADLILKKSNEIKIYEIKSGELIKDSAFKKIKSLCKVLNCHQVNAGIIYSGNYLLNKSDISIIPVKEWLLR